VKPRLTLDSPQNPRVKALVKLKERRAREREGRFLIEGTREISRALKAGISLHEIYFCPAFLSPEGKDVLGQASLEPVEMSEAAFRKVSYRENPDGLLAVAPLVERQLASLKLPENALVLVVDGLEKPGNLGALLRTADGAGLDAVVATGKGTDLNNPNVIRASMGSVFSRPVLEVEAAELIGWLKRHRYRTVAASPHATRSYWQEDYRGPTALVLGAEHEGLSPLWEGAAQGRVAIPMRGLADSLNVATAGALLIYEALRQREAAADAGRG
jgi:TrmH family RNA methyltransferase